MHICKSPQGLALVFLDDGETPPARVSFSRRCCQSSRTIASRCRCRPPFSGWLDAIAGDQGLFVDVLATSNIARMAAMGNSHDLATKE